MLLSRRQQRRRRARRGADEPGRVPELKWPRSSVRDDRRRVDLRRRRRGAIEVGHEAERTTDAPSSAKGDESWLEEACRWYDRTVSDLTAAPAANPVPVEAGTNVPLRPPITPSNVAAHGFIGATPTTAPPALPAGSSHLTLPQWLPSGGPMVIPIVGNAGISTLTGMGVAATIIEVPPLIGAIILLIATGVNAVVTSANDAGSPAGERFAAAVSMAAGTACGFVCAIDHDGQKKWFPMFPQSP